MVVIGGGQCVRLLDFISPNLSTLLIRLYAHERSVDLYYRRDCLAGYMSLLLAAQAMERTCRLLLDVT